MIDINSRVIYLLTGWLPTNEKENQVKPLSAREWSNVAQKIYAADIKPKDIRSKSQDEITSILDLDPKLSERIVKLLSRSGQVVFELEKYRTRGYELLTRADANYPKQLKKTMLNEMPPFFWHVGEIDILSQLLISIQHSSIIDNSLLLVIKDIIINIKNANYSIVLSLKDENSIILASEAINNDIAVVGIIPFGLLKLTKQSLIRDLLHTKKLLLLSQSYPTINKYYKYQGMLQKRVELNIADKILILNSGKLDEIINNEIDKIDKNKIYVYNLNNSHNSNKKLSEFNNIIDISQILLSDPVEKVAENNDFNNITIIYTIGHSNHALDKFIDLLKNNNIEKVIEVRTNPKSSYTPHFNKSSLIYNLKQNGIQYLDRGRHLGGRPEDKSVLNEDNKILEDEIEKKMWYKDAITELIKLSKQTRIALMCAEENPLNCHRGYIISHTLLKNSINVEHIRGNGKNDKGKRFVKKELHQGNLF